MNTNKIQTTFTPDRFQQAVIQAEGGCHLVLAPPGYGKTQILIERIRRAHEQGMPFDRMLCLTFTNRATRGMEERIEAHIADKGVNEVYVGNVHRLCSKFLFDNSLVPAESSVVDDEDAFSILARYRDEDEYAVQANYRAKSKCIEVFHFAGFTHQLVHEHLRKLRLHPECVTARDVTALRTPYQVQQMEMTPETTLDVFIYSDVYEDLIQTEAYDLGSQRDIGALLKKMGQAWHYMAYEKENKLLNFEDLLMLIYDALRAGDKHELKWYDWIQVDEVQNLSPLQLALVDGFTSSDFHAVTYLGDKQQTIFSFMGAKINTLDALRERCEGHIHRLFVNHRSPQYLLDVFNVYVEQQLGIDKNVLLTTNYFPQRKRDELQAMDSVTINSEYRDVVNVVFRLQTAGAKGTTVAIVSANADAEMMSRVLSGLSLSHFKVSGDDLFALQGIKLLLAHLNVLANEHNFIGWSRLFMGLYVFESNAAAHSFVQGLSNGAMLPIDLLTYPESSYVQESVKCYEQQDIVVFDTETIGLDVFEDDIVQIMAVRMRQGKVVPGSSFVVFMGTDRDTPQQLGEIENPLIAEMQRHVLHSHAEGLQMFTDCVGDSMLLGHNADYDYHILDFNPQRYLPVIPLKEQCPRYLDSLKFVRLLEPNLREYKSKYLLSVSHLEGENAHLADADTDATYNVVRHCYGKAKFTVPSQLEWICHPRFKKRTEVLRENYSDIYNAAKQRLYQRKKPGDESVLVREMQHFYAFLYSGKLLEPQDKLHYVTQFLTDDIIDQAMAPSLVEQLWTYVTEINTLKEADLCNSQTLQGHIFVTAVYKAKGPKFDNVIIFDAVDGHYPSFHNQNDERLLAEDKRKFCVAMTRAKERLYVAWSTTRTDYYNCSHPRDITPFMMPILKFFEE